MDFANECYVWQEFTVTTDYLVTVEPHTGERAYVLKSHFRPIKELKDNDVSEYKQYY